MRPEHEQYFAYLSQRSRLGHWYRRHWLYPRICRQLHGRVLDVGCGIGDMLRFRPGTVGVDINAATVAFCREQGLDARQMEVDRLPFGSSEFDGATLDNVLEHIEEPMPLLVELRRVLRPDATLVVGVPGPLGFAADSDHKIYYDEGLLRDTLGRFGFDWHQTLRLPLPIDALGTRLRSYCIYGVFSTRAHV